MEDMKKQLYDLWDKSELKKFLAQPVEDTSFLSAEQKRRQNHERFLRYTFQEINDCCSNEYCLRSEVKSHLEYAKSKLIQLGYQCGEISEDPKGYVMKIKFY